MGNRPIRARVSESYRSEITNSAIDFSGQSKSASRVLGIAFYQSIPSVAYAENNHGPLKPVKLDHTAGS